MKNLLLTLFCLTSLTYAAQAAKKIVTIKIKAAIYCDHCQQCESCGKRLEDAVYGVKGVKRMDLDTKENTVEVIYNSTKTNPDEIRKAIAAVGFDADDLKGNQAVYATWDDCCKKQ
jgi:copper chaperone CopZ